MTKLALIAFLSCMATPAFADDEAQRTTLFREATAFAEHGDWKQAAEKFRAVIAIRSAPKALIALAVAEDHLGHLVAAKHLYEKAVIDAHASNNAADEKAASTALGALVPRIAHVAITIVPPGSRVVRMTMDGQPLQVQDGEYDVDPGQHVVVLEGVEFEQLRIPVTIAEKQRVEVRAQLASKKQQPQTTPQPDGADSGPPIPAIVIGISGVVLTGVAFGLWAAGKSAESNAKDLYCPPQSTAGCDPAGKPMIDDAHAKIIAGDVFLAIGFSAVIAGATWWLVSALSKGSHAPTTALSF